ncbi:EamA/RhaT family transporter [Arcanobacterium hippocoleae]
MISPNIPLAVGLQIVGSFCFALAAKYQHGSIAQELGGNPEKAALSAAGLWKTVREPKWLLGMFLLSTSLLCQVIALIFAPVSIVQPVGLLAFPWSVLIQNRVEKVRLRKTLVLWVLATVFATGIFTVIVSKFSDAPDRFSLFSISVGAVAVYLFSATLGVLGWRGKKSLRALFWGSGGAMLYGLEAALAKTLVEYAQIPGGTKLASFWIVLIALIVGSVIAGWMVQQGYATGKADVVVAAMTITSPVVAVIYGIAVLGEGTGIPIEWGLVMVVCGFIALSGVVQITRLRNLPAN